MLRLDRFLLQPLKREKGENNMAKNYCVCILFNKDLTKTLLIEKAKGKLFEGMYNGLGGKLEVGESAKEACVREVFEESSERIKLNNPVHIATIHFPYLELVEEIREDVNLHCFYDVIDEVILPENREGKAHWMPVEFLLQFPNDKVVGYGNLAYFCNLALMYAKK